MGIVFEQGQGVPQDLRRAVALYTQAADQGHAGAQYNLGVMFANGDGAERDWDKAVEWMTKAVQQGHLQAVETLPKFLGARAQFSSTPSPCLVLPPTPRAPLLPPLLPSRPTTG